MNIILATLNSKFIHSSLSIRYLKAYMVDVKGIELMEFTINQRIDYIVGEIFKKQPDILGFSTYIWNREETLKACQMLKIVNPDIKIILGGPEVSYDGVDILNRHNFVDYIVYGEGEATFSELVKSITNKSTYDEIDGLIYREDGRVIKNPPRSLIMNLDAIPSPYTKIKDDLKNKIVYFESSRGCPFNCQFCLSSTLAGVRYFSMDRVKEDLRVLIESKVRQIKFVDRTFNANKGHAMEVMKFIVDQDPINTNFHFEITAHLLDEEILDFFGNIKEGLFQFEIGVQSTKPETLEAVKRISNLNRLKEISTQIGKKQNIHQHLDLIAGLPHEDYPSFKQSFNDVYAIRPEKIQIGFLKLLKGSGLRDDKDKYGFKFLDIPPYEVLKTKDISYGEMLRLKAIEDLVEKYYNEGYLEHSIKYLIENSYKTPFDFFEDLSYYWEERRYHTVSHRRSRLYKILFDYYTDKGFSDLLVFREIIKYDYLYNNKNSNIPSFMQGGRDRFNPKQKHIILKNPSLLDSYLKSYKGEATKRIINKIHIENFRIDVKELIRRDYIWNGQMNRKITILFEYREGPIIRCKTHDITEYIPKE